MTQSNDPRVAALRDQIHTYAAEGTTLDLDQGADGTYETQFTEPSPWGKPVDRSPTPPPAAPAPPPTPRRKRWPGGNSTPVPEEPETVPSPPPTPPPEPIPTYPEPLPVVTLGTNTPNWRRLAQDLPWAAVAVWGHIAVGSASPWVQIAFGGIIYLATLFWLWLILKKNQVIPAIAAAIALSAIPLAIQFHAILYAVPLTASYLLSNIRSYGHRAEWFCRALIAIAASWPIASVLLLLIF